MKKDQQTAADLLNWCEEQKSQTLLTVDRLLDGKNWQKGKNKKALQVAGQILSNLDLLQEEALREILPQKQFNT